MHVAAKVAVAAGAVGVVGLAAWALARKAGYAARSAPRTPIGIPGQPPPKPGPPSPFQDGSGKWFVRTSDGRVIEMGADGATVDGVHFSAAELGLTAATGGAYATTKYYLAHPDKLPGDITSVPGKVGDGIKAVGDFFGIA